MQHWPKKSRSGNNPPRLRVRLAAMQGYRCFFCGREMQWTNHVGKRTRYKTPHAVTREHLIPRAHGGTNDIRNLAASCLKCNTERGDNIFKFEPHPEVLAILREQCQ